MWSRSRGRHGSCRAGLHHAHEQLELGAHLDELLVVLALLLGQALLAGMISLAHARSAAVGRGATVAGVPALKLTLWLLR